MRSPTLALVLLLVALIGLQQHANASLTRMVRQTSENVGEKESTSAKEQTTTNQEVKPAQDNSNQSPRLYPDIPQQPQFVPPFNGISPNNYPAISHHHGQTPFVPFGIQIPTSRLNTDQQPVPFGRVLPPPKQMTPAERLQSQQFANGLGRRLLSMIGIESPASNNNNSTGGPQDTTNSQNSSGINESLKALQDSTVLQQLNKGVNSIYGGLSKMYNSTVQEQLNLLQERFKSETQNSTHPWQQRMAEQVPQFFKQVATKVGQAQEQLNRVWQDVSQAAQGNNTVLSRSDSGNPTQSGSFFSSFDNFMSGGPHNHGDFFNNIGRSLGFSEPKAPVAQAQIMQQQSGQEQQQRPDLGVQLREFWQMQVQPQIGMVRNQMARVWRDLTASGAFSPETIIRSRSSQSQGSTQNGSSHSMLLDDILKEVDMTSGSEYTMIEPKSEAENNEQTDANKQAGGETTGIKLSPQMQNRLIAMQRELNQLWLGLTNSLQGAINNVKNTVNPPMQQLGPQIMDSMASNKVQQNSDPAINEIDGKVRDLSKLQRDADMVYDTVQQQQRDAQQRQTFGDRFKNFFNNVDLSGVNQLPDRIGQQFNRFGNVVGDLWSQLPERWDNFMSNMRPNQQQQQMQDSVRAKMQQAASSTTTTPSPNPER